MELVLLNEIHFYTSGAVGSGFSMGVEENINVVSLNSASAILRRIDDSVYHDAAAVRNDPWINRDGMVCGCNGSSAGTSSPASGTLSAGTISCGFKCAQGTEIGAAVLKTCGSGSSYSMHSGAGKLLASCIGLDQIGAVSVGTPGNRYFKTVITGSVGYKILPVLGGGGGKLCYDLPV